MKKVLSIAWKDLLVTFHDRSALILMLLAPFLLTLGLGAVTGAFAPSTSSGLSQVPVWIVNQDGGKLGGLILEAFQSDGLKGMFAVTPSQDPDLARRQVEENRLAAAVIIPADFSASLLPASQEPIESSSPVEIYANPARPVSSSVVQAVVSEVIYHLEGQAVSARVTVEQLIASGRLAPQQAAAFAQEYSQRLAAEGSPAGLVAMSLDTSSLPDPQERYNPMAFLAPAMAVLFLMYTVTQGARSLLAERNEGTLPRMLSTPTTSTQVLGGKLLGVYATGVVQVGILVLASSLLFGLRWGQPVGVVLLILSVVAAATGWGILLASLARSHYQVSSVGSAMMLLFGILGGTFMPISTFPPLVRIISKVTPNAWVMDGFVSLGSGGGLEQVLLPVGALVIMAAVLFTAAVLSSSRRWASGFLK